MSAQFVNFSEQGRRGSHNGVRREGGRDEALQNAGLGFEKSDECAGCRKLRSVDQAQPLLGTERDRRQPRSSQALACGHAFAPEEDFPLSDQGRSHMGQRRKVARRSNGALDGNDRRHIHFQHGFDLSNDGP